MGQTDFDWLLAMREEQKRETDEKLTLKWWLKWSDFLWLLQKGHKNIRRAVFVETKKNTTANEASSSASAVGGF